MSLLKLACQKENLIPGSFWLLNNNINGYKNIESNELSTEAVKGRKFEILKNYAPNSFSLEKKKLQVRLLEDGYICWFKLEDLMGQIESTNCWEPILLTKSQIIQKLPRVLNWIERISKMPNHYLWGGTIGPGFDCSGLIQAAFCSESIWLPRDAYQQENFCTNIRFNKKTLKGLKPGDLLFFGDKSRCNHVAIYKGEGDYWHSSGIQNGRNGIGIDHIKTMSSNSVSSYYLSILRGAGRVDSCHDGTSLD